MIRHSLRKYISQWLRESISLIVRIFYAIIIVILNKKLKTQSNSNAIVVSRIDRIGDFIIWLDAAKELQRLYPDKAITLLCLSPCTHIAEATGYFDTIIPLSIGLVYSLNPCRKWQLRRMLHGIKADILLQCIYSRSLAADYVSSCVAATQKITPDSDSANIRSVVRKISNIIYDKIIAVPSTNAHELEHNAELLHGLGLSYSTAPQLLPYFESRIVPAEKYFVIFAGARDEDRRWSTNNFASVADYIIANHNLACCLCGSSDDTGTSQQLINTALCEIKYNLTGRTSITDLIEIIRNAEFIISNDTSAIHIAVGTNTPSICVLGPWELGKVLPYKANKTDGRTLPILCYSDMVCRQCHLHKIMHITKECKKNIIKNNRRLCIDKVSPEIVIKEVEGILKYSK